MQQISTATRYGLKDTYAAASQQPLLERRVRRDSDAGFACSLQDVLAFPVLDPYRGGRGGIHILDHLGHRNNFHLYRNRMIRSVDD